MPPRVSKLGSLIKAKLPQASVNKATKEPAWKGPTKEGISQSLLHGYIACRERFRIRTIEGLQPVETFRSAIEYGNMWHICEENLAAKKPWAIPLKEYCVELAKKYPTQAHDIQKFYQACLIQFPVYTEYWKNQADVKDRTPIFQEKKFAYDYKLPSGRIVKIRGKLDSCDYIGKDKKTRQVFLQENKSKGEVDELKIQKYLTFDLQTMLYTFALDNDPKLQAMLNGDKVVGVRYNVIRRPHSGGVGSIKQGKGTKAKLPETLAEYHARLKQVFIDNADTFFFRFKTEVTEEDKQKFLRTCLNPLMENLLDDYEWWEFAKKNDEDPFNYWLREEQFPKHMARQYILPYGGYNPVADGRTSDIDEYLHTGNAVGLHRITNFFPEL